MKTSDLVGRTLVSAEIVGRESGDDAVVFVDTQGVCWRYRHHQDCCESVEIEDVVGDLADLVGSPLLIVEESEDEPKIGEYGISKTWTFYRFATAKGDVSIRWLGESNGYYSESVDLDVTLAGGAVDA